VAHPASRTQGRAARSRRVPCELPRVRAAAAGREDADYRSGSLRNLIAPGRIHTLDAYFAGPVIEAGRLCWAQPALGRLVAKRARSLTTRRVGATVLKLVDRLCFGGGAV
jgi:hypothetical protein